MAATDHSALAPQFGQTAVKAVTLNATAANSREIKPPGWARRVSIRLKTSAGADEAGAVACEGTDGAAIDADHMPIASGECFTFTASVFGKASADGGSFFVVADGASSVAHVMYEAEPRGS
tara:strand:+ start:2187 stop:2549 length:363 start_codon:yes stop_codon:yes gene_type:complete